MPPGPAIIRGRAAIPAAVPARGPADDTHPGGGAMTLLRPSDWLLRLACGVIWYVLSLALFAEIGALAGWIFDEAALGARLALLPHGLFWLWLLAGDHRGNGA